MVGELRASRIVIWAIESRFWNVSSLPFRDEVSSLKNKYCFLLLRREQWIGLLSSLRALSFLILGSHPSSAVADNNECAKELAHSIENGQFYQPLVSCVGGSVGWTFKVMLSSAGPMIDGTALGVFHMPQPDIIPESSRPLPVLISPLSNQVWKVEQVHNGEKYPSGTGFRYYVWAPGNNRSGWKPDGVLWGRDSVRMFRCLAHDGMSCITYYVVPSCSEDGENTRPLVISVSRSAELEPVALFDSFEQADLAAHEILRLLKMISC